WDNKPGVSNLLTIYSLFADIPVDTLVERYQGRGYGDLKKDLVEVMSEKLGAIQQRYRELDDPAQLDKILRDSAEKAAAEAEKVLLRVKDAMGLVLL
ncbi:MAG TPA: tryptophan--tRNA ligase, partial [Candidatus Bathyarchaeia archaeon]|nr:tryptophan--tRNA ligase [Candidatus Bathyarchaeia archaeon]